MCGLIDFPVVTSGQPPQPFREWLGEATDQMLLNLKSDAYVTYFRQGWLMGEADVCRTSSFEFGRSTDVISAAAILDPRWRRRKWRHTRYGVLFRPYCGGGKRRPFRFRSPSWITLFVEPEMGLLKKATWSGRAAIFHHRQKAVEKVPYTTHMGHCSSSSFLWPHLALYSHMKGNGTWP